MSTRFKAFTVDHFRAYARKIKLDTGAWWEPEDFQLEAVEPIFAGEREVWIVIPEENAKTTLMAGVGLYALDYSIDPWVPLAASSRDQANILANQAFGMISRSPGALQRFRIYKGYKRVASLRNGGVGMQVYAADQETADGVIPYPFCICDEGHRGKVMEVYRLWKGKLRKRGSQIIMISTAGEPGTEFEKNRDAIRDKARERIVIGARVKSVGPNITMNEWALQDARQWDDMEAVKAANPLSAITEDELRAVFESPTFDRGDWLRLKCNIPARSANAAISETEWTNSQIDIPWPDGEWVDWGVDVGWRNDTFAIVPLLNGMPTWGFRILGKPTILEPPRDGSMMLVDDVKNAMVRMFADNPATYAVMDVTRGEDVAQWMENELGLTVIDRPQGNANAAADYETFMRVLRDGTLRHLGDHKLRIHVMNAIARTVQFDKKRFDRPSQSRSARKQDVRVIDALTAAAMVVWFQDDLGSGGSGTLPGGGDPDDYRVMQL